MSNDLDDRLKHGLKQLGDLPRPEVPVTATPARGPRVPTPWRIGMVGAVVAVAAAVAIGVRLHPVPVARTAGTPSPSAQSPTPTSPAVPWADTVVAGTSVPQPTEPHPACTAAQLSVVAQSIAPTGAPGPQAWQISVSNTGAGECFLGNWLDTRLTVPGSATAVSGPGTGTGGLIDLPPTGTGAPTAGASGTIWSHCTVPTGSTLEVSPNPALGWTTVQHLDQQVTGGPEVPTCRTSAAAQLQDDLVPQGGQAFQPLRSDRVTHISAPSTAHPGETVAFQVTVADTRNPALHSAGPPPTLPPLALSPCPAYTMQLQGAANRALLATLNCRAAPASIATGQSLTFDMQISIPATASAGPAVLTWTTVDPTLFPTVSAGIDIVPGT